MKTRSLILLAALLTAGLAGWLLRGMLSPAPATDREGANVCRVVRGRFDQQVKARGIVKPAPSALVRVGFPFPKDLARWIKHLVLVEGDQVAPAAELAQLDHDDLKANLAQLTAELGVFERRLAALKSLEPVEVRLAEAGVAERKAQLEQAQRVYARAAKLVRTATSAQELETAAHDQAVGQARLEQAEAGLQQTTARFRNDIAILEAQIQQAKAAIQTVEVQIGWCTLRSPLTVPAQVFAVHQRQGELTSGQPTVPVLTLLDPNQLQVHLFVDEVDLGRIQVGHPVMCRLEAHPDQPVKGRIVRILPQPILQENVVYYLTVVEVEADQRSLLRAEMTVIASVQAGSKESVLWLPVGAVRSRPEGWYVVRSASGGPVEVPVRIGWKDQGRVEILAGLAEGEEVLLQP
jgi:HlyD family secretion protein/macrolide-specific efflux system membrane fusion protein